jgi:hypothetical protein
MLTTYELNAICVSRPRADIFTAVDRNNIFTGLRSLIAIALNAVEDATPLRLCTAIGVVRNLLNKSDVRSDRKPSRSIVVVVRVAGNDRS